MKRSKILISTAAIATIVIATFFTSCHKLENPIKYPNGTFPDSVYNLSAINSIYDDYNMDLPEIGSYIPLLFSSNRGSSGGQFNIVPAALAYTFNQTTGKFSVEGVDESTSFYTALANKANSSSRDEFGPYSIFSSTDGFEYLIFSSGDVGEQLDLYYIKYLPPYGTNVPDMTGPLPVKVINTGGSDAYISFNLAEDTAYFCSDRSGNFDIYMQKRTSGTTLDSWMSSDFQSASLVDSINSSSADKFPFVYKKIMVFSSNRPGGMGGFDLYYSIFRKGKWSSPVNFGPKINTSSDEFRPLVGYHPNFTNNMLLFSSDRPGGKGGKDLYFTGFTFPK
ncbi:MAG: hypothetical protein U0X39_10080 [Bacteroidales bacterium]